MGGANLQQQIDAVKAAPVLYLGALIVVAGAIWFLVNWAYSHRLERLRQDVVSEQGEVARLRGRLVEFDEKLSGASPDEAKARIAALEARLDALSPRRLSTEQKNKMVPILHPHAGSAVTLVADGGSADATPYMRGIVAAFRSSGWQVVEAAAFGIGGPPPTGVGLGVSDPAHMSPPQQAIADALTAAGIAFDLNQYPTRDDGMGVVPVAQILVTTPADH